MKTHDLNFWWKTFNLILVIDGWCISCKIALGWLSLDFIRDKSILYRELLGAARQEVITWANVDPGLCRQTASQGHNELSPIYSVQIVEIKKKCFISE